MFKRFSALFLIVLCVLLLPLAGWVFFFSSKKPAWESESLEYLLQGNYPASEKILQKWGKKEPHLASLYQGYLYQIKGDFCSSEIHFQKALSRRINRASPSEVLLAQATNAYLEKRDSDLCELIELAQREDHEEIPLPFFQGLLEYVRGNYSEARKFWSPFSYEKNPSWMFAMFSYHFSPEWREIHLAHCYLEEENFSKAREILEKNIYLLSSQEELQGLASLFLGHSYVKEAEGVPFNEKESFYKLATYYFERGFCCEKIYEREKESIYENLARHSCSLIEEAPLLRSNFEPIYNFVHLLESENRDKGLQAIATALSKKIISSLDDHEFWISFLKHGQGRALSDKRFFSLLSMKLFEVLPDFLKDKYYVSFVSMGKILESLPFSTYDREMLFSLISQELYHTIALDDDELKETFLLLSFLREKHLEKKYWEILCPKLLDYSKALWHREGQEKKATSLMELSLTLAEENEKRAFLNSIERFLSDLYLQAERANTVRRLFLIQEAFDRFHIGGQGVVSAEKLANHLADAVYLLKSHQYPAAQIHAEWILRNDPKNQEALRLLGLASYYQGEYARAHASLEKIADPDEHTRKALILSKIFVSQEQEKNFAQFELLERLEMQE